MSLTGNILYTPEDGWKRIYCDNTSFSYKTFVKKTGNTNYSSPSGIYYSLNTNNNTAGNTNPEIKIEFTGTKLRILGTLTNMTTGNTTEYIVSAVIDGEYCGRLYDEVLNVNQFRTVLFEKENLLPGRHSLLIRMEKGSTNFWFDSIDIEDGEDVYPYNADTTAINTKRFNTFFETHPEALDKLKNVNENTVLHVKYSTITNSTFGTFGDIEVANQPMKKHTMTNYATFVSLFDYFKIAEDLSPSHNEMYSLTQDGFRFDFSFALKDGEVLANNDSFKTVISYDDNLRVGVAIPSDVVLTPKVTKFDFGLMDQLLKYELGCNNDLMYMKFLLSYDNGQSYCYYDKNNEAWKTLTSPAAILDDKYAMTIADYVSMGADQRRRYPGDFNTSLVTLRIGMEPPANIDDFDPMEEYIADNLILILTDDPSAQYEYTTYYMNMYYIGESKTQEGFLDFVSDTQVHGNSLFSFVTGNSLTFNDSMDLTNNDYTTQVKVTVPYAASFDEESDYTKLLVDTRFSPFPSHEWGDFSNYDDTGFRILSFYDYEWFAKTNTSVRASVRLKLAINPTPRIPHRDDSEPYLPIVTNIKEIQPGQCIAMSYKAVSGKVGTFSLGKEGKSIIPDIGSETPDGYFYFICVGKDPSGATKLIADRNIQTNISWEALNEAGLCVTSGMDCKFAGRQSHMRLFNTTSAEESGIYDLNEWDAIISYYNKNGIVPSANETWNAKNVYSWTMVTPQSNMSNRIIRGGQDYDDIAEVYVQDHAVSTSESNYIGFRPVLLVEPYRDTGPVRVGCDLEIAPSIGKCKPGQAIVCEYKANDSGEFGLLNFNYNSEKEVITDPAPATPNGKFYFVCVGYAPSGAKKFVADRNLQTNISWEALNEAGLCVTSGRDVSDLTGIEGSLIRLMHSDVTNYSMDMSSSEWDAIMMKNTIGATNVSSDGCHNWNMLKSSSWMLDTPHDVNFAGNVPTMSDRVVRGNEKQDYSLTPSTFADSSFAASSIGFRPVLEVPLRYTAVLLDSKIFTTHINEHNPANALMHVVCKFSFVTDDFTLDDVVFRVNVETTPVTIAGDNGVITPNDYIFEFDVPLDMFVYGNNTLSVIAAIRDNDNSIMFENEYKYTIIREKDKEQLKFRDFEKYTDGFEFNGLDIEQSAVVNNHKTYAENAPTEVFIPQSSIRITLEEV